MVEAGTQPVARQSSAGRTQRRGPVARVMREASRRVARALPLPLATAEDSGRGEPICEIRCGRRGGIIETAAILSCSVVQRPDVGDSFCLVIATDRSRLVPGDAIEVHLGWSETGAACVLRGEVTGAERDRDERGGVRFAVHGLGRDRAAGPAGALVLRRGRDLRELRARMTIAGEAEAPVPCSPRGLLDVFAYGAVEADARAIGTPALRPGVAVELERVGRRFEGTYVAGAVAHAFAPGVYTTELTLSRSGPWAGGGEDAAARSRAGAAPRTFFAFLAEAGT